MEQSGGYWISMAGACLLAYGLVRDLYIKKTCPVVASGALKPMRAICLESVSGAALIIGGLALQFLGWTPQITLSWGTIVISAGVIVAIGHATRRWVLVLIKTDNHQEIAPTWKS